MKAGAVWPKTAAVKAEGKQEGKPFVTAERKKFWSFLPLAESKPPSVKDPRWAKTEIDKFVLARLEKEGLKPVRAASRRDLLRRATLDLTGLPPTLAEIDAFVADLAGRLASGREQRRRLAGNRRRQPRPCLASPTHVSY